MNFCQYLKEEKNGLRIKPVCSRMGEKCPNVEYRNGQARPNTRFLKYGCQINKQIVEELKEISKEANKVETEKIDKVKEKPIQEIVEKVEEKKTNTSSSKATTKTSTKKTTQKKRTSTTKKKSNNKKK